MRKLSEYKDKEAIELLANMLEPTAKIFGDKEISRQMVGGNKIKAIQLALKRYPDAVIELLAVLEGVPVNEYHCNIVSLPQVLLAVINDEDLSGFFTEQAKSDSESTFGSATENTKAQESIS